MKEIIIDSKNQSFKVSKIKEIFAYKDLLFELISRDIKIRHKQTILGVLWVIFQPLMSTLIFTVIFGLILKVPSDSLPYPVFVFIGLNYWNFFSSAITSASGSLSGSESLIKKVYFPRIIIPMSAIFTSLFDFLISTLFLILFLIIYRVQVSWQSIFVIIPMTFLVVCTSTGIGLFLSSLNVRYRDVRQILPFFIQILIFLTPVFYPVTMLSQDKRWILSLNPLSTAIELTRNVFTGTGGINYISLTISSIVAAVLILIGFWYFYKTEKYFADLI